MDKRPETDKRPGLERTFTNYLTLFLSTLYLSAFTFGGGYVIVPLMKKRFADKLGWLTEEEMLDITAIAQASPGAMAVNASILIGWRLLGALGAALSVLGTILPPLIVLSAVSAFYAAFRDNLVIAAALKGMMAGVCAVVFDVAITMTQRLSRGRKVLPAVILIAAFTAAAIFKVNAIYIILFCGVLGALLSFHAKRTKRELL